MPYGVPDDLWRKLPPEDQNELINEYYGRGTVPDIGGYAPPPGPPPPPEIPRVPASTKPGEIVWAYVRSLNSFPGNHPYFDADRAAGVGGYMLEAHDSYLEFGAAACRAAGFKVGVWSDPHGQDAKSYAGDLIGAAHKVNADAVAPDPESTGKGYAGSPGWQWNQDAADAIRALDPHITVIVTPTPNQDDFNYGAWTKNDSLVWVQLYGEKLTDLFNAAEVIKRVIANGVPASRIGALIPAGAVGQYIAQLQALGVTHWAIYTIDDVSAGDRSVPFGGDATTPQPPLSSPPDEPGDSLPDPLDDYDVDEDAAYDTFPEDDTGDVEDPPDDLGDTSARLAPLLTTTADRTLLGVHRLTPSPLRGPHPPIPVVSEVLDDINGHKVPVNVAVGMRAALLIVQKGIPYVWGGTDPNRGLDCSAFCQYVLRAAGYKKLARVTYDQAKQGRAVSAAHRQPLDLVFFHKGSRGPEHVALYMARGWAVHEPHTGEVAQWLNLATYPSLYTRRYIPNISGYSPTTSVPVTPPSQSNDADLDTVSGHWHTLMTRMDGDRHGVATRVRQSADRIIRSVR